MQFRTEFNPDKLPVSIQLHSRIVTIGSCFAEVMGRQLADNKLNVLNNPFGTLFNPVSIAKLLSAALDGRGPDADLFVERDGLWFHYDFHSSFWATSREQLEQQLLDQLAQTGEALRQANWLILTLGTSMVYRHLETDKVVANCHKMRGDGFEKYLYTYEHTHHILTEVVHKLKRVNPGLQVLLTVSPVRHTRDSLPLNQVSKSTLRVISHELTVWHDDVYYFPAYELMMDDLRDYRFYEADLIHPNAMAEEYIFQKFADSVFDAELRTFIANWQTIRKALEHRPFHEQSESHRRFLENLLNRLDGVAHQVDVEAERASVQRRLRTYPDSENDANQAA